MIEFRPLAGSEIDEAIRLWETCGLTRPRANLAAEAGHAITDDGLVVIASFAGRHLIGTAMADIGAERGRISHLFVDKDFRRWGVGRQLVRTCEEWLGERKVFEVEAILPTAYDQAEKFLQVLGYEEDEPRMFVRQVRLPSS